MSPERKKRIAVVGKLIPLGIVLALLLALGWWSGYQRSVLLDASLREKLLRKTVELSHLVNPQLAQKLTFTEADKKTLPYELLCEQLIRAGATFPQRGIYTMVLREGRIFFGPENYRVDDPMASAPGTEYQKPSPEYLSVFRDQRPAVVGPVTDEFGTFITALAPVFDPKTGQVLMVLGMDVLAGDWESRLSFARKGPFFLMIAIMFLVAGVAALVFWRNRSLKRSNALKIKSWVMMPVALAMLGGCFFYGIYEYQVFNETSRQEMILLSEQVRDAWNRSLIAKTQIFRAQLDHMCEDASLMKAWKDRNREALQALAEPFFRRLKETYGGSHFYFIDRDRTCFLRAHQPGRYGDLIDRATLLMAERSGEDSWGIELGPLSALTFRYVRPVKIDDQWIGYLELGEESEKFSRDLARTTHLETLTALRKEYISQEKFEAGRDVFDFTGAWEAYPDFVVTHQTLSKIPLEVDRWLQGNSRSRDIEVFNAKQGKKRFICGSIPLLDAMGRDVSRLFILRDIRSEILTGYSALLFNVSLLLVLLGGVLAMLWSVVGSAEEQLDAAFTEVRESAEAYRRQFSENTAVMLLIDPQNVCIIDANGSAVRFYGYSLKQLLGMNLAQINTLPMGEIQIRIASALANRGGQFEFRHRLANGSVRDVEIFTSPIRFSGKEVLHSIIHDITDRKQAEKNLSNSQQATLNILEDLTDTNEKLKKYTEDLMQAKNDLEVQTWGLQKANDGIKALYQELEKKNADLAKLDKLKDDFISIVAHELRNPLGVIREAATLMLDGLAGPVAPGQKVYVEMVRRTAERLIGITSDLLDLAKIESGKVTLRFEQMDLLVLIRQSCEGIALRANKKGLTISEDFPGEKLEITGDFDKLSQVMINLLSNAYKFTEKGGITVEVKDLGEEVRCAVKDTGRGISREDLSHLFSKFEQFGKPTASAEKGSGLGLVISKSIVEAHGGLLWAESELGQGTSFFFTVPKNPKRRAKIGEILVEEKMLTPEQLADALKKQKEQRP